MKTLTLKRISDTKYGTFGVLLNDNIPFVVTLENPWKDNQEDISCIPLGLYLCKRHISPRFGEVFRVTDVKDRTHILFHWGNLEKDTHGCILIGESFDPLNNIPGILSSKKGFREFMSRLEGQDDFWLDIIIA